MIFSEVKFKDHNKTTHLQVAMTYSVELFICMIIGLVMGHAIFNTGEHIECDRKSDEY